MFGRLLILFITVPFVELMLLLRLGSKIGLPATLGIIVITAILGAALTRSQGTRALSRYREALQEGRLPHQEVLDGLMILVAGAVLLTPGFLTDAFGFLLLVPAFRRVVRKRLGTALKGRVHVVATGGFRPSAGATFRSGTRERVVEGKVIDPARDENS